jgi:hypothetical protein
MFSVQTFYQPLFSHCFHFRNIPLAILFPSVILFPSKSFPHQKTKPKKPLQNKKPKVKAKGKKQKPQAFLQQAFYKQGGAHALGEGHDIVTGETCLLSSLKARLGDAAVLLFCFLAGAVPILAYRQRQLSHILPYLCPVLVGFS